MVKVLPLLVLLNLSPTLSFAAESAEQLQRKIDTINQHSEKLLGISLTALLYLNEASPNSYLLLSYLEDSGKLNDIKSLEAKGYVKLETVENLPDGRRLEKHLRVIPTALGYQVQTCMQNLKIASTASTKSPKSGIR